MKPMLSSVKDRRFRRQKALDITSFSYPTITRAYKFEMHVAVPKKQIQQDTKPNKRKADKNKTSPEKNKQKTNFEDDIMKQYKQMSKVIWQKAASPNCHSSRLQMNSSDIDPYLIHGSLNPRESPPPTAFRSVHPFLHSTSVWPTHRQTDTQTTLRVTSIPTGRIYEMHAMRPNNKQRKKNRCLFYYNY